LANLYAFGVILEFRSQRSCGPRPAVYTPRRAGIPRTNLISHRRQGNPRWGWSHYANAADDRGCESFFTKPAATVSGIIFSGALFILFTLSELRIRRQRGEKCVELDQFNLAQEAELTQDNLDVRPGNILVPISTNYALYALEAALRRAKRREAEVVVLHVQVLQRAGSGESDLTPDQLFSTIEQSLFSKVLSIAETEGKPVRLAVAARMTSGKASCAWPRACSQVQWLSGVRQKCQSANRHARSGLHGSGCLNRAHGSHSKSSIRPAKHKSSIWGPHAPALRQRDRSAAERTN